MNNSTTPNPIESWTSKHAPKNYQELSIGDNCVTPICQWLSDFWSYRQTIDPVKKFSKKKIKRPHPCSLLIRGNHGHGKTSLVNNILKELNYKIINVNFEYVKNNKSKKKKKDTAKKKENLFQEDLVNSINTFEIIKLIKTYKTSINENTTAKKSKKKTKKAKKEPKRIKLKLNCNSDIDGDDNATEKIKKTIKKSTEQLQLPVIIIDNLENITVKREMKFIIQLQQYINNTFLCPLILIGNDKHNKAIKNISKLALEVRVSKPEFEEMIAIANTIIARENILFENSFVFSKIIEFCQNDIRRMINTLQDLKSQYKKTITYTDYKNYIYTTVSRMHSDNLYTNTEYLLTQYESIYQTMKKYELDSSNLPLMFQCNYLSHVNNNIKDTQTRLDVLKKISRIVSKGNIVESNIRGSQNWEINEIYGMYSCAIPSYYINKYITNTCHASMEYIKDYNFNSRQKLNVKNIKLADAYIENKNIFDYMYMSQILKKILEKDDGLEKCAEKTSGYNLETPVISSIMKIDQSKAVKVKKKLTPKQLKILKEYIDRAKFW